MNRKYLLFAVFAAVTTVFVACSPEVEQSNKAERNAIKEGNELYAKEKFAEAADKYSEALKANAESRAAQYNHALATLMSSTKDTALLKKARLDLNDIAHDSSDPALSEKAIYNLANDAVYIGDALLAAVDSATRGSAPINLGMGITAPQGNPQTDSIRQVAYDSYRQAIENYKVILRKNPANTKALQNLRITQLKLPPEQNNQQQQQQQQQQQEQQKQQQKENNDKQALNAVQMRENQSRRDKDKDNKGYGRGSAKPW